MKFPWPRLLLRITDWRSAGRVCRVSIESHMARILAKVYLWTCRTVRQAAAWRRVA